MGAKAEWLELSCRISWPLHSVGKWHRKIGKLNGGRVNPHIITSLSSTVKIVELLCARVCMCLYVIYGICVQEWWAH